MDEELKKRVAMFRLRVISDFTDTASLAWGEIDKLMRDKSGRKWQISGSLRSRISESTLKEWLALYRESGNKLESLYPKGCSDQGKSRAITEETASGLIVLRKKFPNVTLPVFLRQAKERRLSLPARRCPIPRCTGL